MKKTKLLTPLLTGLAATISVAPLTCLTSCSETEETIDLFEHFYDESGQIFSHEKKVDVRRFECCGTIVQRFRVKDDGLTAKEKEQLYEALNSSTFTTSVYVNKADSSMSITQTTGVFETNFMVFVCYKVDFSAFLSGAETSQLEYSIKLQMEYNKKKYVQRFTDFSISTIPSNN